MSSNHTQAESGERQTRVTPRLLLAPMEGVTDFATRLWLAQTSRPDEATTPFLRVTKDYPSKRISANFLPELELSKEHGIVPCVPQLMASETGDLIRIAEHFLARVPFVDINCGCPSPTVVGNGAGSSLLQNPERFNRYLGEIVSALGPERVSVKMRVGFSNESEFPELLEVVKQFKLARLTIHGRTRADRYTGKARWFHIQNAAQNLPFPVVGSGDVVDATSLDERLTEAPSIAGVMVGRGALRNPWVFSELREPAAQQKRVINRALFRATVLQFVLLQEMQMQCWDEFYRQVRDGFFGPASAFAATPLDAANETLAARVFKGAASPSLACEHWPISRVSLARGKMLWNYLRSGLNAPAVLSVALLRSSEWMQFVRALENVLSSFPHDDMGLAYQPEWDWVYSGESAASLGGKVLT
jgi:tRNA-dihydrouridine synthase